MGRQVQVARGGEAGQLWLSMLVDAMEEAARPDFRSLRCEQPVPAALTLQLAQPAQSCPGRCSGFGLRN
jgi:hypothetical protein